MDNWIETFTGKKVNIFKMTKEDVDINDISHALSMTCRFNGHCKDFYSVAEHSVRCLDVLKDSCLHTTHEKLQVLMHDAAEAYIGDIPRPIKQQWPFISELENKIQKVIFEALNIKYSESFYVEEIKKIDDILLATEARDLNLNVDEQWTLKQEPLEKRIISYSQKEAESLFLNSFHTLMSYI